MVLVLATALGLTWRQTGEGGPGTALKLGIGEAWAQTNDGPDALGTEMRRIALKLQCPVCEGTSVADSRAALAQDMRRVISEKLAAGETEAQIIQYFVDRYGVGILRNPPTTGIYAAVWWVPPLAIALGLLAILAVMRVRRRLPGAAKNEAVLPEEMEKYRQRLRDLEQGRR